LLGSTAIPLVSFHDVGKTYRSLQGVDYAAVEHFSVEIEVGEFFCLLGPSGCGKTTVLKMLTGFEAPTAGRILRAPTLQQPFVLAPFETPPDVLHARDNRVPGGRSQIGLGGPNETRPWLTGFKGRRRGAGRRESTRTGSRSCSQLIAQDYGWRKINAVPNLHRSMAASLGAAEIAA